MLFYQLMLIYLHKFFGANPDVVMASSGALKGHKQGGKSINLPEWETEIITRLLRIS